MMVLKYMDMVAFGFAFPFACCSAREYTRILTGSVSLAFTLYVVCTYLLLFVKTRERDRERRSARRECGCWLMAVAVWRGDEAEMADAPASDELGAGFPVECDAYG